MSKDAIIKDAIQGLESIFSDGKESIPRYVERLLETSGEIDANNFAPSIMSVITLATVDIVMQHMANKVHEDTLRIFTEARTELHKNERVPMNANLN